MSFIELMRSRYTTKKYNPNNKIEAEKIEELKEILQLSPSSINSQPWKFKFISDETVKKQLSEVSWTNTQKLLDCDTVVVFSRVDDIEAFEKRIEIELPKGAVNYYKKFIRPKSDSEIRAWFDRQVYLALGIFLSACAEMEIDSTPMEGIQPKGYDKVLGQNEYATVVAVAIGHRDSEDLNQPSKKPKSRRKLDEVIELV